MSNTAEQKIKYAVLHEAVFVPGVGSYGPTLVNDGQLKNREVTMLLVDSSTLMLTIKGTTILVPTTMTKYMIPA